MKSNEVVETLDNFATISRDGEQEFRAAAGQAHDPQLRTVFETAAQRCAEDARELESQIAALGGQPFRSISVRGALNRLWTNLKSLFTGRSDKAILEEVEHGEDVAKSAYENAIAKPLPPQARAIVERRDRAA